MRVVRRDRIVNGYYDDVDDIVRVDSDSLHDAGLYGSDIGLLIVLSPYYRVSNWGGAVTIFVSVTSTSKAAIFS